MIYQSCQNRKYGSKVVKIPQTEVKKGLRHFDDALQSAGER